jgi:hypothetical protein
MEDEDYRVMYAKDCAKVAAKAARTKKIEDRKITRRRAAAKAKVVRDEARWKLTVRRWADKAKAQAAARLVRAEVVAQRRADKAAAKVVALAAAKVVRAQVVAQRRVDKAAAKVVAQAAARLVRAQVVAQRRADKAAAKVVAQAATKVVLAQVVVEPYEQYDDDVKILEQMLIMTDDARVAFLTDTGASVNAEEVPKALRSMAEVQRVIEGLVDAVVRDAETPPAHDRNVFTGIPDDRVLLRVIVDIMKNSNPGTQRDLTKMLPEEYAGLDRVKVRMHIQMALVYNEVVRIRTTVSSSLSRAIMKEIITKDNAAITIADLHVNTAMVMAMVDTARVGVNELFDAFEQPGPVAMKWKDGSMPKLIEQPHRRNLNLVLNNFPSLLRSQRISSPDLYRRLVTYMQKIDKDTGEVEITYKQPKGYKRHFADGSLGFQTMPRGVRGLLAGGLYLDVDMYCAHLVFLVWLCMKHNIPCPVSAEIVHDRAAFLERLGGKVSKHELICIVYGKSFKDKIKELAPFEDEIAGIVVTLNRLYPDFERVARDYCTEKEKWCRNLQYKAVSRMLAHVENNALQIIYTTLEGIGYTVGTMCFDGIMVENDSRLDIESAIVSAHQAVLEGMGMTIKLVSKPFETLDMSMFSNDEVHKVRHDSQFETIAAIARIVNLDAEVAAKCGYTSLTRSGEWVWDADDGKRFMVDDSGWILDYSDRRVICNILSSKTVMPTLHAMDVTTHIEDRVKEFSRIIPADTPFELKSRLMRLRAGTEAPDDNPPITRPQLSFGCNKDGREYDVMCIVAGMGAGKTYQSKRAIMSYLSKFEGSRCISLSCRIAYADFATGLLDGFESYQKNPRANHLVCSPESLHTVANTAFDVVWLDEFRSLIECFTSVETNKHNLHANLDKFRNIVSRPGVRVLISDADLLIDDAFQHSMAEFFPGKAVRVDVYPNILPTMKKKFIVVPATFAYTSLCEDLKMSKKVGVVCDTKTAVVEIEQLASQLDVKHIVFHGDADQKMSRDIWKNPDFSKYQLVAWNSKITNGNDVTESFDRIYYMAQSGMGASFKDGAQGLGRFRSVKDPNVYTVLPNPTWQSHGMLTKSRLEETADLAEACKSAHSRVFSGTPNVGLTPDWFAKLQNLNEVLCKQEFFRYNFISLQLSRGHDVLLQDGPEAVKLDMPGCVDDARMSSSMFTESRVCDALEKIYKDVTQVYSAEKNKRKGTASMEENILVDVYYIVKPFLIIKGDIKPDYKEFYMPIKSNMDGIRRLMRFMQNDVDLPNPTFNDQSCKHRTYTAKFKKVLEQLKVPGGVTKTNLKDVYDDKNTQELLKLLSIPSKRVGWRWRLDQLLNEYCHVIKSDRYRIDGDRVQMYHVVVPDKVLRIVTASLEAKVTEMPGWKILALNRAPVLIEETQPQPPLEPERARPPPFVFSTHTSDLKEAKKAQRGKHAFSDWIVPHDSASR